MLEVAGAAEREAQSPNKTMERGERMKTHAVKEILLDCLLCVEVEPQPPEWTTEIKYIDGLLWRGIGKDLTIELMAPIAIGDTVYRGGRSGFWDLAAAR